MEFGCHDYPPYDGCPNMFFMFCTCVFNWALGQKKKGPPKCPQDVLQVPCYILLPSLTKYQLKPKNWFFILVLCKQERAGTCIISLGNSSSDSWQPSFPFGVTFPENPKHSLPLFGHPCRSPRPSRYTPGCSWSHPGPQRMVVRNQFQQLRYVGIGWNMVYDGACCIQLYIT